LEKLAGLHSTRIASHATVTNLFIIVAFVLYWLMLRKKKREMGGAISFGQAVLSGLIMTLVVTLLTPLWQWLTIRVISPDYFTNMINYSTSNKLMEPEEASAYFSMKNYIMQSLMFAPLAGIVTTIIMAWIVSRSSAKQD
jgi:hypothetical protein